MSRFYGSVCICEGSSYSGPPGAKLQSAPRVDRKKLPKINGGRFNLKNHKNE